MLVPIDLILPNPEQPRTVFDQAELDGLAQSIRENGVIQPLVVEHVKDYYVLVDGERRLRAAKMAGLTKVNVDIQASTNHNGIERLQRALVANVQRAGMGPVDEALAYQRLLSEYGSQEAVAQKVGVSIATISMRLSLLEFPETVQKLFNMKRLPLDLVMISALKKLKPELQSKVATSAASRRWSAGMIMRMIKQAGKGKQAYVPRPRRKIEPELVDGKFNALALINGKQLPEEICAATVQTCQKCPL